MLRRTPFIVAVCVIVCTSACATRTNNVKKEDVHKNYLYSKEVYTVALNKEQLSYMPANHNTIHTLVVNIQSMDAKNINKQFQAQADAYKHKIIRQTDGMITSFTGFRGVSYVSNNYISIITTSSPYLYASEGQAEVYKSYIFDRKNGSFLTQDAILNRLHLSYTELVEKINDTIVRDDTNLCKDGDNMWCKELTYDANNKLALYINNDNSLVVYVHKQQGLIESWVPLIIPYIHVPI